MSYKEKPIYTDNTRKIKTGKKKTIKTGQG